MDQKRHVDLGLTPAEGSPRTILRISLRPKKSERTLRDTSNDPQRDTSLHPIQLQEGEEYRYQFLIPDEKDPTGSLHVDPEEMFLADDDTGWTGTLRPGLNTGTLPVTVRRDGAPLGRAFLEVRSTKLDYMSHYRWMLQDIAEQFAEAIMERFAPTEQQFSFDTSKDAATLYQRFVFIKHLISGEQFEAAIQQILGRPHRLWMEQEELRRPGQGLPAGSGVGRQIASAPGPRIKWPGGPVEYLPAQMMVKRTEETRDTAENRFIKFALSRWRDLAAEIGQVLAKEKDSSPVARGRREVDAVVERLDELLSADLFAEVGPLTQFPAGSQVLQKRAGYRDIYRAYVQFEAAAAITWDGGEDVYSAGQRNVAVLYEFWVFLQVVGAVAKLCTDPLKDDDLFEPRPDGLGVALKRGQRCMLSGTTERHGRRMQLEVWFNLTFGSHSNSDLDSKPESWTVPLRPDCSVRIVPETGGGYAAEQVWLHFDAKYRVDHLKELFVRKPTAQEEEAFAAEEDDRAEDPGRAKRADLWKMHAYRDAIRRSAGAYVVYPGEAVESDQERDRFKIYHELLPGLGAFALRPTDSGAADGFNQLRQFLDDVTNHVASQATQHERSRFWLSEAFDKRYIVDKPVTGVPVLTRPPADTIVLLRYVRSPRHLDWIREHKLLNIRADQERVGSVLPDAKELTADFVVLYEPRLNVVELWRVQGKHRVMIKADMYQLGYPHPKGTYYCLPLEELSQEHWPADLTMKRIEQVKRRLQPHSRFSDPLTTSWLELVR